MTPSAVLFDWGGTLTPFHDIDLLDLWRVAARVLAPDRVEEVAAALADAEHDWWVRAVRDGHSGTTRELLATAAAATGLPVDDLLHGRALAAHLDAWTEHTLADPAAAPLLTELRRRGIRTGLLSNTHWPREWHERWLERDGLLDLIEARVYTSELDTVKPHPAAFRALLDALDVDDPSTAVFVGDRPHDDIAGAQGVGMRAVPTMWCPATRSPRTGRSPAWPTCCRCWTPGTEVRPVRPAGRQPRLRQAQSPRAGGCRTGYKTRTGAS